MKTIFNAFKLHDQEGVPLYVQADMATVSGAEINYAAFACDALNAGWSEERVKSTIFSARPDIEWKEFKLRLAALWTVSGKLYDPECWKVMKEHIVNTWARMNGIALLDGKPEATP